MAVLNIVTVLLFAISFVLASPLSNQPVCPPAQIISARGSGEDPGEGKVGFVAAAIAATRPRSQRDAVDYPARLIPYSNSSSEGTAALTKQLTAFVQRCPKSKIVLLGYSQGAHIIGDTLCGGGGVSGIGPRTNPIPKRIGDHGESMGCRMGLVLHLLTAFPSYGSYYVWGPPIYPEPVIQCWRCRRKRCKCNISVPCFPL